MWWLVDFPLHTFRMFCAEPYVSTTLCQKTSSHPQTDARLIDCRCACGFPWSEGRRPYSCLPRLTAPPPFPSSLYFVE